MSIELERNLVEEFTAGLQLANNCFNIFSFLYELQSKTF